MISSLVSIILATSGSGAGDIFDGPTYRGRQTEQTPEEAEAAMVAAEDKRNRRAAKKLDRMKKQKEKETP